MEDISSNMEWMRREAAKRREAESKTWQEKKDEPCSLPSSSLFGPPIKVKPDSRAIHIRNILGDHKEVQRHIGSSLIGVDRNPSTPGVNSKSVQQLFPKPEPKDPTGQRSRTDGIRREVTTSNKELFRESASGARDSSAGSREKSRPPADGSHGAIKHGARRESTKSHDQRSSTERKRTSSGIYSKEKELDNRYNNKASSPKSRADPSHVDKSSHELVSDKSRERREKYEKSKSTDSSKHRSSSASSSGRREKGGSTSHGSTERASPNTGRAGGPSSSSGAQSTSKCPPLTLPNKKLKKEDSMEEILKETMLQPPLTAIQTPRKEDGFNFSNAKSSTTINQPPKPVVKKVSSKRMKKVSSPKLSESSGSESEASDSDSHSSDTDSSDDDDAGRPGEARHSTPVIQPAATPTTPEKEGKRNVSFNLEEYRKTFFKKDSSAGSSDISPSKESAPLLTGDIATSQPKSNESVNDDGLDKCVGDIVTGEYFLKESMESMLSPLNHSGGEVVDEMPAPSKPPELKMAPSCVLGGVQGSRIFGIARDVTGACEQEKGDESDSDMKAKLNDEPPVLSPKRKSSHVTTKRRSSAKAGEGIPDTKEKLQNMKVKSKRPQSICGSSKKSVGKAESGKTANSSKPSAHTSSSRDVSKSKTGASSRCVSRKHKNNTGLSKEFISDSDSIGDSSDNETTVVPPPKLPKVEPSTPDKPVVDTGQKIKNLKIDSKPSTNHENTAEDLSILSSSLDLSHILEDVTAPGKLLSPVPSVSNLSLLNTSDPKRRPPSFSKLPSVEDIGLEVKVNAHSDSPGIFNDTESVPVDRVATTSRPELKGGKKAVLNNKRNLDGLEFVRGVPSIPVSINLTLLDITPDMIRTLVPQTSVKRYDKASDKNIFQDFQREFDSQHSALFPAHENQFSPQHTEESDMNCVPKNPSANNTKELSGLKTAECMKDSEGSRRPEPVEFSNIVGVEKCHLPSMKIPKKRPDRLPLDTRHRRDSSDHGPLKRRQASDERRSRDRMGRKRYRVDESSPHSSPYSRRGSDYEPSESHRWPKGSDYGREPAPSPTTHSPYWNTSDYRTPQNDEFSDRESVTPRAEEHWEERRHDARNERVRVTDVHSHDARGHKYDLHDRDKWSTREPRYRDRGRERARDRSRERLSAYDRDSRDRNRDRDRERRRESGDRESFDRERDRGWERDHIRGRDYDHGSHERKRPRNNSRDWDAPREECALPGVSDADFEPPSSLSPYHGESKQRVASQWSAVVAGHSEPPARDVRDRYDRCHDDDRSYSRYLRESRPRVLPLVDKIESADFYLSEAKRLKHQADRMTEKVTKLIMYIEGVLSFIMCGYSMERSKISDSSKIFKMYQDTLKLLRHISSGSGNENTEYPDRIRKLNIFSLRIQALLCLRLYRLKKPETTKLKGIIDEHNKQAAKGNVQAPSPYSHGTSTSAQGGWKGTSGTPSPMSPQPSPAGSVASVGSAGSSSESQPKMVNGNVSSTTVCVPTRIHSVTSEYLKNMHFLYQCHDIWDQADNLLDDKDFFGKLDQDCGVLSFQSTVPEIVRYIKEGSLRLKLT